MKGAGRGVMEGRGREGSDGDGGKGVMEMEGRE